MAYDANNFTNYIYISHIPGPKSDEIRWWPLPCAPEKISDSMTSTYATTTALGRSAPVLTYSSSGPRNVQIEIQLHRDMMTEACRYGGSNVDLELGEDYVDNLIKALQSISVPNYNLDNKAVEPPLVALRLSNHVFIKGIVSSEIGVEYQLPIQADGKYAQARLSLTVTEVDPYDAKTVYQNGSFRGLVGTLGDGLSQSKGGGGTSSSGLAPTRGPAAATRQLLY